MTYNPNHWFWTVAGDASRAWSSAAAAYVPADDGGFVAWLAAGNVPTSIINEAELHDVLAAQFPAGIGTLGTVPQRAAALLGGSVVTVTSTGTATLNGVYPISAAAQANMTALQTGIAAGIVPGGGPTFPFSDATGTDHEFTATQFTEFAASILEYVFALVRCVQGKSTSLPSPTLTIS